MARGRFDVRGSVAVVTGASSGLGRRFALDLAGAGAVVIGLARRGELLDELEPVLADRTARSATQVCDVSDTSRFRAVLGTIEREHGRIDLLINNAGIGEPGDDTGDVVGPYRRVFETNFFAAVAGTLTVLPGMLDRQRGAIVNVSSDTARAPGPGEAAYGASKAALSAFSESISFRTDGTGVSVHVLYPGWVPTAMGQAALDDGGAAPPKMVRRTEEQVSRLLLDRIGGNRVDIDAAPIARLAPLGRSLFPSLYRKGVRQASSA